jgi:hypothetical protein
MIVENNNVIAICVLRAQSDTLLIERLLPRDEIVNVDLRSQHTQDFSCNRNYDYYILFYLDQINVIPYNQELIIHNTDIKSTIITVFEK